jgi:hypothetical protein
LYENRTVRDKPSGSPGGGEWRATAPPQTHPAREKCVIKMSNSGNGGGTGSAASGGAAAAAAAGGGGGKKVGTTRMKSRRLLRGTNNEQHNLLAKQSYD